ncbi:MAG: rhodanese-like domain-containing protein [Saprospiraceae bacterium]|nr:rhodanese-like domain-containing protein [Saprospiraceae bacterium]
MEDITVQALRERLENNETPILIDVREPYENAEFNIGGKNIPLGTLSSAIPGLQDLKDKEVIVYCAVGGRSGMAKSMLVGAGFTKVRNLLGGMMAWKNNA